MTHFKIDIQLPLNFNPEDGGEKVPEEFFFETYEDLLKLAGGINTSNIQIIGSWINPHDKKRYNDKSVVYTILVDSEDKMTIHNATKIKELKEYKEILKKKFKQHEIFMVASRCVWL
ncbi:hypothetical protein HYW74_02015 [Candidatus Pacearchaeota archaeon]|nr:hypothetical protein [Candidatus Pacearchaeota archaeon]